MNKQKQLVITRSIFFLIVFVSLGVIVVTEKASGILAPKIQEKMSAYLSSNYSSIKNSIDIETVTYANSKYKAKVTSKENKKHYFYIYYANKKITDTYKKDYLEGENLFKNIKKELIQEIKTKTNETCHIEIISNLNEYTEKVQERLIKETNLSELKFYIIKKELIIDSWNQKTISNSIEKLIKTMSNNNITPKYYQITITNKNDITESIEISNITENFIETTNKEQIISDIINDNNSKLLKQNKIKYEYLN